MKRIKCKYCGARPRVQFASVFRDIEMCHDCACEYSAIFDGFQGRRKKSNPLFESFKKGWESEEEENNLQRLPIPPVILEYYNELLKEFEKEQNSNE